MAITSDLVKALRERTGGGLMECKKTLEATNGDIEAAIKLMRETGKAKADKKAGRVAAEGVVMAMLTENAKTAFIIEVNCETDFVAKDDNFRQFVETVAKAGLAAKAHDVESLMALNISDKTTASLREELIAKIGENINVRRVVLMQAKGSIASYVHNNRIGVLVDLVGGDNLLGKDLAMHIAATKPMAVRENELPQELIAKEKEIYLAQIKDSGKPPAIMEKMIKGKLQKFIDELTLINQPFVKDATIKIADLLKKNNAEVNAFVRFEVGEGIEKETCDFAAEVMAQTKR